MQIKRTLPFIEDIGQEAGQRIDPPLRNIAVAAVIDNPFAGRFERDLSPLTKPGAEIGQHICQIAIALLSPHKAESYGKAAIIGMNGEQEYDVAMLTAVFGTRAYGLDSGALAPGKAADVVLLDAPHGGTQSTALAAIKHGDIAAIGAMTTAGIPRFVDRSRNTAATTREARMTVSRVTHDFSAPTH